MARLALMALCGLMLLASASARLTPGRDLLQVADCTRIPHCATCRNQRVNGATVLQCMTCDPTYKPNADFNACQCAPGYKRNTPSGNCEPCSTASWCLGGDDETAHSCDAGMTTLIDTAAREDQCVTEAGYGFDGTHAAVCEPNFYSTGKTRNPCRACGAGLVTNATLSDAFSDCLAPKGYYFDKNAAKPCPRGTYTLWNGRAASCTACPAGVTTLESGSFMVADCKYAKPGYYFTGTNTEGATTAAKCATGSFQAAINLTATACTLCPTNMVTLKQGAISSTACVAKPGYEYNVDNTATGCAQDSYKTGYNRRPCLMCGPGFKTLSNGVAKISFADCYIPQGFGTTKAGATYTAAQCAKGFYGAAQNTFGVKSLPCTPCPAGMDTAAAGAFSPDACNTKAGWGYDQAAGTAVLCPKGFFSGGGNRNECVSCGEGYTTALEGSDAKEDCQVAPGYGYKGVDADPEPCAKGFFGDGFSTLVCQPCSGQTTTTVDSLATSQAMCDVCVAGYGGTGCTVCAANSYNQGDEVACKTCASGVAPAGSLSADACIPDWTPLQPDVDTINVTLSATFLTTTTAVADVATCKTACTAADSTCMFYSYDAGNKKCLLANELANGADKIAFKSATGTYTIWKWTSTVDIAADLGTATTGGTIDQCLAACDNNNSCVLAVFKTGATPSCQLKQASTSPDFKACEFRAVGAKMPSVST